MDGRDWRKFMIPYEQTVEELKIKFKAMRVELKMREEYAPIEFVTGRVKRIASTLEKAKRLQIPIDKIETDMEDIAGIRIMCQFVEDIQRVAQMIRDRKDLRFVYAKDYITNYKESGYRSYHMIVDYPVQTALGEKHVLVEIQLRTLAMNFWATIEHSLNYKYKQSVPDHIQKRLRKAAEAAYQLDNEMSSIREEIVESQMQFEDDSNLVSRLLSEIQKLYSYHRIREAVNFQMRFNELWEQEDIWGLKELSADIQEALERARKGGQG